MQIRSLSCFLLSIGIAGTVHAAEPASQPATAPSDPPPQYSVPYRVPTVEGISQTLDHIRQRLDAASPVRLVDSRSGEEITDFSKPIPTAIMDRGPEKKFPPISYPMGVINSGMLLAAEATGDKQYSDFVAKRFQFYSDHLADLKSWNSDENPRRNPFWSFYKPDSLDYCGSMGAAMVKARQAGVGPDLKTVIDRWADYISHEQFRLSDGTLARSRPFPNSLWADDMYMSVPLLAQMGKLSSDTKYYDDAVAQVLGMSSHLFVPEKGLFAHGWHEGNADNHPRYYWGRANGWCMVAMVELLSVLPEDHPKRAEIISLLRAHARGVAELQSGSGMWHQLLDHNDSYLETSCTAMFSFAMARAVNRGWLSGTSYASVAVAGWNGLSTHISEDGKVDGTCIGTGYADDAIYYYHRPAVDDIHGYGPVILAGAEMIQLLKNENLHITATAGGPIMFIERK